METSNLNVEIWKPIPDFDFYEASSFGRLRSLCVKGHAGLKTKKPRILKLKNFSPYQQAVLCSSGKRISARTHVLVATAFYGKCPDGFECAHLDGNKRNNKASNLKWVKRVENANHKMVHGTLLQGNSHPMRKVSSGEVLKIRNLCGKKSQREIGKMFGLSQQQISKIKNKTRWENL